MNVKFLFRAPQQEIASLIRQSLQDCREAFLVSGFVTVEGVSAVQSAMLAQPEKIQCLVAGAGTYRAFQAFDHLISGGVSPNRLFVHLGHSRLTGPAAAHRFYRYHPMLHSKIYLFYLPDGTARAFIGSHNMTGFAMLGKNGEAGVLIEAPANSPAIQEVRAHIDDSRAEAINYDPSMKEAYAWWAAEFLDGFKQKVSDWPRDGEAQRTIVVLAVRAEDPLPKKDEIIYFEIPAALGRIQSLQAQVHIYFFSTRPPSPSAGLIALGSARASLWCRTEGLEIERGGVELLADWYVEDRVNPVLKRAPRPFRPAPSQGMQQVRVKVWNEVFDRFEYVFGTVRRSWEPVLDEESRLESSPADKDVLRPLQLVPPEDLDWYLVRGLRESAGQGKESYLEALRQASPESGSYILLSTRRRKLEKAEKGTG